MQIKRVRKSALNKKMRIIQINTNLFSKKKIFSQYINVFPNILRISCSTFSGTSFVSGLYSILKEISFFSSGSPKNLLNPEYNNVNTFKTTKCLFNQL